MIPKIVAKGTSFKGAAAYLLHDKDRAETNERVEWVETRNLMTNDPEKAWRIMAATAMDQDRLKEEAGVAATGRKSNQSALHLVLSWHPDESRDLDRDEMRRAADGAIKAIGGDDRQAMLIVHNDEEHAHIHVLLNRVSPEDGRMLTSSKDRLKLSTWAETYERERGQILCHNRVANNERRDLGELVVYADGQPHNLAKADELVREPANDNPKGWEAVKAAQRAQDRDLMRKSSELIQGQKDAWSALQEQHKQRIGQIEANKAKADSAARSQIGAMYHPRRIELNQQIEAERQKFDEREERLFGRITNAMETFEYRSEEGDMERRSVIGEAFQFLSSGGARREALDARHDDLKAELNRNQVRDLKSAHRVVLEETTEAKAKALNDYEALRGKMIERQLQEREQLKKEWQERHAGRNAAIQSYLSAQERRGEAKAEFDRASPLPHEQGEGGDAHGQNYLDELAEELERRELDDERSDDDLGRD